MRIAFLLLLMTSLAAAQPVIDGLDDATARRVGEVLNRYDHEVNRLQQQRSEISRKLIAAHRRDASDLGRLLDDALANRRALVEANEKLIGKLRSFLSPRATIDVLATLHLTDPGPIDVELPRVSYDPDPPRSCDPFAAMHGCKQTCDPFEAMHGCFH